MIVSTKYASVESVTYSFTPHEVREALMKAHNIKSGGVVEFDLGEDGDESSRDTTITVRFEKAKEGNG